MEIIVLLLIGGYFFVKKGGLEFIATKTNKTSTRIMVQEFLHHQHECWTFEADPATSARLYVDDAWKAKPDYFSGTLHDLPHHRSGAIYTLALAAKKLDGQKSHNLNGVLVACLNAVRTADQAVKGRPLGIVDDWLISQAMAIIEPLIKHEMSKPINKDIEFLTGKGAIKGVAVQSHSLDECRINILDNIRSVRDVAYKASADDAPDAWTLLMIDAGASLAAINKDPQNIPVMAIALLRLVIAMEAALETASLMRNKEMSKALSLLLAKFDDDPNRHRLIELHGSKITNDEYEAATAFIGRFHFSAEKKAFVERV